jgi:ABC-type sugar transport system ATPase subunit
MPNRDRLGTARDNEIVLGIRPEHLHVPATAPPGSPAMDMKIDVVEHMGDHQYVYLRADGVNGAIIMKAPGMVDLDLGQIAKIHIDTSRAHVFEGRTEHASNITLPTGFAQQQ